MTNTDLLKEIMTAKGIKQSFVAKALGISRQSFWLKLNNKVDFTFREANTICEVLGVTSLKTKNEIFFGRE